MTKKVAVILSGCGVYDGAEVHESTLSLLALDQAGYAVQCYAPDIAQMHVLNHITGEEMQESRNVLVEASRIARGDIKPLSDLNVADYDALYLPGGFGAAKNLSDFAVKGADCIVNADLEKSLTAAQSAGKPIVALCIAPAILAKLFKGAKVTVGAKSDAADTMSEGLGAEHVVTTHGEIVIDEERNLITSPCYMLEATISQIYDGAKNAVDALGQRL